MAVRCAKGERALGLRPARSSDVTGACTQRWGAAGLWQQSAIAVAIAVGILLLGAGAAYGATSPFTHDRAVRVFARGICSVYTYQQQPDGSQMYNSTGVQFSAAHNIEDFASLRIDPAYATRRGGTVVSSVTDSCTALFERYVGVAYSKQHKYGIGSDYQTSVALPNRTYTCQLDSAGPNNAGTDDTTMTVGTARGSRH